MQFLKFSLLILLPYSWQEELKTQNTKKVCDKTAVINSVSLIY